LDFRAHQLNEPAQADFGPKHLPEGEWLWLESRWTRDDLATDRVLCDKDCQSQALWLLEDAVVARVASDDQGHAFEIAVDGPGRIACGWLLSGDNLSPWRTVVRRSGAAKALLRSEVEMLPRFAPVFYSRCRSLVHAEVAQLANQFALSRRQTARSLLADRLDGYFSAFRENVIAITHSTLAHRLNLRRATVTLALQELEGAGAIRSYRARIELKDPERLRSLAQEH